MASSDLYELHREAIEQAISRVCRTQRLSRTEAEDFASIFRIHVLDDDCAVLRAFGHRATMGTFLHSVATHRFQDWRNAQWGKWRPSAEARRLGTVAVLLETRIVRDQLTMDEAIETLRTNHGITEARHALETMAERFPVRHGRTFVGEEVLDSRPADNSDANSSLEAGAATSAARKAAAALEEALDELTPQDRMILRMRFNDDRQIAKIARQIGQEPKMLYRRVERLLVGLRTALEARGVDAESAREIFAHRGFELAETELESKPAPGVRPTKEKRGPVSGTSGRW